jgi:hypothetical protein
VGWAASIGHQLDVGGKTPGGNGCDATEIYQEGLRIPAVKLYARGEPVEPVFEMIDRNVRVPRQVLGDVRSQVAACFTGERGYLKLMAQHGAERFSACTTMLLDPGRAARAVGHREDARRHLRVHRLDRRRRHRSRPHPDRGRDHGDGRPHHRGFHRLGSAGTRGHQLAAAVHQVRRLRDGAASDRRRSAEQRGLLPPDRGHRAARAPS